jgi:hypothetical protein
LVIDTVVCLTLAKWETVSGQFGGYLTFTVNRQARRVVTNKLKRKRNPLKLLQHGTCAPPASWKTLEPINKRASTNMRQAISP